MLVAAALVAGSGCATGQYQFVADHRVHIDAPRPRSTVTLPLSLHWSYDDFRVTGPDHSRDSHAGYFAVFVDRAPVPAGKDLRWLARNDPSCRPSEGCPNEQYFTSRQVFTTTQPQLTFDQLPKPASHRGAETHTITVVLLDGSGRRIGESAWYVDFKVHRKAAR